MFSVPRRSACTNHVPSKPRLTGLRRSLTTLACGCGLAVGSLSLATGSAIANPSQATLADGVYAFGESSTAHQLGTTYMVMQVSGREIKGGFYQPASSFDCFHGEATGTTLNLAITDSYAQTEYPFAMTLESEIAVASENVTANQWIPNGFYRLTDLSTTDHAVLQTCSNL